MRVSTHDFWDKELGKAVPWNEIEPDRAPAALPHHHELAWPAGRILAGEESMRTLIK
ncbi:hypothetical protein ACFY04_39210 [Streptomyces sp. NPDC001549]|uniref:hypothetical protein n=1 Tax=Streptomyces sp. NPDC001549 TaxID=3364586 RepID=UPI0036C3A03F